MTLDAIRGLLEHAFVLDTWFLDGKPRRAPEVEGNIVFCDGIITMNVQDRTTPGRTLTKVMAGSYELTPETFINTYPTDLEFTETASGVTTGHGQGFKGKRTYHVDMDAKALRLTADQTKFTFTEDGMVISHADVPIRIWKRA